MKALLKFYFEAGSALQVLILLLILTWIFRSETTQTQYAIQGQPLQLLTLSGNQILSANNGQQVNLIAQEIYVTQSGMSLFYLKSCWNYLNIMRGKRVIQSPYIKFSRKSAVKSKRILFLCCIFQNIAFAFSFVRVPFRPILSI